MNAEAKVLNAQDLFDIEIFFGRIIMYHKLKDLTMENIALHNVSDFVSVPINDYIDTISSISPHARKAKYDIDFVIEDSKDMLKQLQSEYSFERIKKDYICNSLSDIFKLYFLGNHFLKYADNDEIDENGVPAYFPFRIKELIDTLYPVCEAVFATPQGYEFIDLLNAHTDKKTEDWTYVNRTLIITKILLGKVRRGRDITRLLFERIPKDISIPQSFKKLCRIKNGRYIIFNTDYHTLDFQLAVLDLLQFVDHDNKLLFNNKVNQYLKNA